MKSFKSNNINRGFEPTGKFGEDHDDQSSDEEIEIRSSSGGVYSKKELFSIALSFVDKRELFDEILLAMSFISASGLTGQLKKALDDPGDYFGRAQTYRKLSNKDKLMVFDRATEGVTSNVVDGARKAIWDAGHPIIPCGVDSNLFQQRLAPYEEVKEYVSDLGEFLRYVKDQKIKSIENPISAVLTCFKKSDVGSNLNASERLDQVRRIVASFDSGKLIYKSNPSAYKVPREPGIMLPHTLDPKEFIGISIALLLADQFSETCLPAFDEDVGQDVRRLTGAAGDYILYSSDPESPYAMIRNPSIHCSEEIDGVWEWRSSVNDINKSLKGFSGTSREEEFNKRLVDAADAYVDSSVSLEDLLGEYAFQLNLDVGQFVFFKFFKRGYSTAKEVEKHSDVIHVVSATVAAMCEGYKPIFLPDFQSVVLFPMSVWVQSVHYRSLGSRPFTTGHGTDMLATLLPQYQLYLALFRLSHVFAMLDAFDSRTAYDYDTHCALLSDVSISKDLNYCELLKGLNSREKSMFIRIFSRGMFTSLRGLILSPNSSKTGKANSKLVKGQSKMKRELFNLDGNGKVSTNAPISSAPGKTRIGKKGISVDTDKATEDFNLNKFE